VKGNDVLSRNRSERFFYNRIEIGSEYGSRLPAANIAAKTR
jgi:hypothetical protein